MKDGIIFHPDFHRHDDSNDVFIPEKDGLFQKSGIYFSYACLSLLFLEMRATNRAAVKKVHSKAWRRIIHEISKH
jgi:hypothetical protein